MDQEITPLIVHTGFLLRSTLTARLKQAGYSITSDQWKALSVIHEEGQMTQVCLGKTLYKAAPAISKIVSKLENMGLLLLQQSIEDKREKLLCLSEKAEGLIGELNNIASKNHAIALDGLSDTDQRLLTNLLIKIKANLESNED